MCENVRREVARIKLEVEGSFAADDLWQDIRDKIYKTQGSISYFVNTDATIEAGVKQAVEQCALAFLASADNKPSDHYPSATEIYERRKQEAVYDKNNDEIYFEKAYSSRDALYLRVESSSTDVGTDSQKGRSILKAFLGHLSEHHSQQIKRVLVPQKQSKALEFSFADDLDTEIAKWNGW